MADYCLKLKCCRNTEILGDRTTEQKEQLFTADTDNEALEISRHLKRVHNAYDSKLYKEVESK